MNILQPRVMICALRGGAGKTIFSVGIVASMKNMGLKVSTFKKGPDFIDTGWLELASGRSCHNLDTYLMDEEQVLSSFFENSQGTDISIIEGNRGIFDGMDIEGHYSSAELSKLLGAPVILIVDVTMTTRTIAAIISGCIRFDPNLKIKGVILNRIGGKRQENLIRATIERYCGIPIIGAVPKLKSDLFPQRHMGLVPTQERENALRAVNLAQDVVKNYIDLDSIISISKEISLKEYPPNPTGLKAGITSSEPVIGYIKDKAFWFYYPENLRFLEKMGARLMEIDSLKDKSLPTIDALYIGGGFPETQAEQLAKNYSFKEELRKKIESGLPVYAECGGLMYMGREIIIDTKKYHMVGVMPIDFVLEKKPQGHGYTMLEVTAENRFFPKGYIIKGHEFHYSRPIIDKSQQIDTVFDVKRGYGLDGKRDGIIIKNMLATYSHIHARGAETWCKAMVSVANSLKNKNWD